MIGLYVHWPYCPTKCAYCDFNAYLAPSAEAFEQYARALCREIVLASREEGLEGARVASIYFGGGTPSLFPTGSLVEVLDTLAARFKIDPDAEITAEANPSGLTRDALRTMRTSGVNRLSIGAQTFSTRLLATLGRDHSPEDIVRAVDRAREAGFDRLNLDVMFGLPDETDDLVLDTGFRALALGTEHLSAYALELEPETVFGRKARRGELVVPGEDDVARRAVLLQDLFADAGFLHYEVSNYARPGEASRHNLHTWRRGRYRGFGAGAHSFVGERRFWNHRHPAHYERIVSSGRLPVEAGEDVEEIARGEWVYLALRIFRLEAGRFRRTFGESLEQAFPRTLDWALGEGWLRLDGEDYVVAEDRRWLLNQIAAPFLQEGRDPVHRSS